jgi:DNA modification methylase
MRGPKAWGQKETAAVLGISTSSLSDDLRLADAIAQFPELEKIKSKRDALRKMYRLREIALIQELARRKIERGEGQDENVMLALGDALELIKNVEDESIDAVITDPPWGIDLLELGGSRSREYEMFDDNMAVGARLYKKIIPDLFRVMKKGAHLWLFFGIEHYERILKWLKDAGFDVRTSPCVWVKEGPSFSNFEYKPMPRYELFFFAVKPVPDGSPNRLLEPVSDVFDYSRATGGDKIHPTEKPVDFMKRLVTLSTHSDQLVLDPFAGSASTLIAALLTKRQAVGFELSPDYYAAADQRIKKYQVKMFEAELGLPVDGDEEVEE